MPSGVYESENRKGGVKGKSGVYSKSQEHRNRIRETLKKKGLKPPHRTGYKLSEEHKIKLGKKKEKHWHWIKDRTKLKKFNDVSKDRRSSAYSAWRKEVWERDNYKCKINNNDCKGKIEAHHILSYSDYPKLRYSINNGITLCHAHHPRKRAEEKQLISIFTDMVAI